MDFTEKCLDAKGWFYKETTVQAKIPIKWTYVKMVYIFNH